MTIKAVLGALAVLLLSFPCAAARNNTGHTVARIGTGWGNEAIFVHTVDAAPVEEGCGGTQYRINLNHPLLKEMLTLLVAAQQSRAQVDLYVDGCQGSVMVLQAVAIH
ncbi:hypothetical protein [Marilutibacter maris]|uniref:hypothetical protein n=1 Tax=Marilutibacter maris TaxID=1605891 RepID=UPI000DAAA3F7|nr:hypothetical protein [Lysobacter maris]